MIDYDNKISPTEYLELRESVGWSAFPIEQAEQGLVGTTYMVVGRDNGKAISLARVQWDGGYIAVIVDVIVRPDYQKHDIGRTMMNMIIAYLKNNLKPGWKIMISLLAAIGKNPFMRNLISFAVLMATMDAECSSGLKKSRLMKNVAEMK